MQIVIWFIIPATRSPQADHSNNALALIVLIQYVPRLYLIFPLSSQIIKATGVVTKTAWAGAAYNLLLYMLASHVCIYLIYSFLEQNHLHDNFCIIYHVISFLFFLIWSEVIMFDGWFNFILLGFRGSVVLVIAWPVYIVLEIHLQKWSWPSKMHTSLFGLQYLCRPWSWNMGKCYYGVL